MKRMLLVISVVALAGAAQAGAFMINVDGREATDLGGTWRIIIDPYENGFYDYRYNESPWGYFRDAKPRDKSDLVEYSFDASETLKVPGDWNTQRDELLLYEGTIWYKRAFDLEPKADKRYFVYFGAANYEAIAYLNGEKLGRHVGGFTPFEFEVTEKVKRGENTLIVKVDNKRYREAVPTVNTDWWNFGGLTRRVLLVETPKTTVRDYQIQLKKGTTNEIAGWVQLDGPDREQTVTVRVPEAGIEETFETDADGRAEVRIEADGLVLWTPEQPKLYDVTVAAESDAVTDRIGFRSIETRGKDILLNGEPIFLRGICIHEETPRGSARATTKEDAEVLLGWAKELNCNFVRLAHYPHQEAMVRAADEMGLLVWSEIPVYWTILWENPATYTNAETQLTEMITRDKNRASVILWSVANETPVGEPRLKFLRGLIDAARALDPTRLITAANENHRRGDTVIVNDPLGEYLDVLGCNEYFGWYAGEPEICDRLTWEVTLDKPLIFSEFGGGALYGYHGDEDTRWTEEYQADIYRHQATMFAKVENLRGTTPWILKDFRSPRRPLPLIQDFWNRKGVISDRGQRKGAFYVLQEFYGKLAEEAR